MRAGSRWMLACLGIAALLVVFRPAWLPAANAAAATVPMLAAAAAWVLHFRQAQRPPTPFIPVAASFYGVCYGLPVFLAGAKHSNWSVNFRFYDLWISEPMEVIGLDAQLLAGAGSVLLVAAAFAVGRLPVRPPAYRLPLPERRVVLQAALWLLAAVHLAWMVVPQLRAIPSLGQFLGPAGLAALGGIFAELVAGRAGRLQAVALAAALVVELVVRFASGTVTQPMLVILFAFLLFIRLKGRISVPLLALGVLFTVLVYPATQEIRLRIWSGHDQGGGLMRTPQEAFAGLVDFYRSGASRRKAEDVTASVATRVGLIFLMTHVVHTTPDSVPYWGGETYRPLVTSWVPRFLWPDKPQERLGQAFRERYQLIYHDDNPTIVNLPWMVELYANFGTAGVLLGMPLFGLLLAVLDRLFNDARMDGVSAAVGLAIVFPLVYQESNFSLMVGSLVPLALALWGWFALAAAGGRLVGRGGSR